MREDLKELIESAEEDLKLAKVALDMKLLKSSAFHSQQCIEKMLKAFLLYKKGNYPFSHIISELLGECLKLDRDFQYLLRLKIQKVEIYYTASRYPPLLKVSEEEAKEAIEIAEKVRDFVLKKLGLRDKD